MTVEDYTRRITRPENCILAFGIPTSERGFRESLAHQERARERFAEMFNGLWMPYLGEVARPFQRLYPRFRKLGVRIVTDLTLAGYSELFRADRVHAIILMSHWTRNAIEFHDGFADVPMFVRATPEDVPCILDLCACHPEELIPILRAERPCHLVRFIKREATPGVWLYFFWELFVLLRRGSFSYIAAQTKVLTEAGL